MTLRQEQRTSRCRLRQAKGQCGAGGAGREACRSHSGRRKSTGDRLPDKDGERELCVLPQRAGQVLRDDFAEQLAQLAKGSALLENRANMIDEDYTLVRKAVFDCIPVTRRKILDTLITGNF